MHRDPNDQSSALSTVTPPNLHRKLDSLEAPQEERFEPSLSGVCKSDESFDCTNSATPLELKQTFDMKLDTTNCSIVARHSIERGQHSHAPGGLLPTSVCVWGVWKHAAALPMWTSPQPSEMHVRGTHNSEGFKKLQAPPPEALNTTRTVCLDVPMQTDSADIGIPCQDSLGNATKECTDGPEQGLVGDKEIQAVTPVSDGMEIPNGSVLQEFHCVSGDEPNSKIHMGNRKWAKI
ncbi:Microtubule-associated tumor suppressor 1 homolog [Lemmus lemmus]